MFWRVIRRGNQLEKEGRSQVGCRGLRGGNWADENTRYEIQEEEWKSADEASGLSSGHTGECVAFMSSGLLDCFEAQERDVVWKLRAI